MLLATVATLAFLAASVQASSHSEAPGTAKGPRSDLSDVYAFQSSATTTTLVMNVSPMQRSDNGPSYTPLDENFFYLFHIDNDGDHIEDITFQFKVGSTLLDPTNPLTIVGPVTASAGGAVQSGLNFVEHYEARVIHGEDYSSTFESGPFVSSVLGATRFAKPVDNVGESTFTSYQAYADEFIQTVEFPKCATPGKLFVGPRREPFGIDLGSVFDLLHIRTAAGEPPTEESIGTIVGTNSSIQRREHNTLDCSTVVSFVIEIPTECLVNGDPIIGAWASVRQVVRADAGHVAGPQFTRLGNPLINELFIGLPDKDKFGSSHPKNDGQFLKYISNPTFPALIEILFPTAIAPQVPRGDLVAILFTGIPGFNKPTLQRKRNVASDSSSVSSSSSSSSDSDEIGSRDIIPDAPLQAVVTPAPIVAEPPGAPLARVADILRLNTALPPTPKNEQGTMGVFALDPAGFPNGRRLGDDVVDIYMRAAMGHACSADFLAGLAGAFPSVAATVQSVCPVVDADTAPLHFTDRAPISAGSFGDNFPFLNIPVSGNRMHQCWEGENPQSIARCSLGGGCTAFSKDLSCTCP